MIEYTAWKFMCARPGGINMIYIVGTKSMKMVKNEIALNALAGCGENFLHFHRNAEDTN